MSQQGLSGGGQPMPATPTGKGGIGGVQPLSPQNGFNINNAAAGGLQQSMLGAQAGMQYAPMSAAAGMANYANPYENQVVQRTLSDLGDMQQQSLNQMGADATAANAFGGSRHGIAEAETRNNYARTAADAANAMRQQGFNTALGASQFDVNSGLQGAQQRLSATNQLGALSNQAFNTGQAVSQQQMRDGAMQQGLQQLLIDAAKNQFAGYTGSPANALTVPNTTMGVTPAPESMTEQKNPGLFDYLKLPFMLAGGA